MHLSFASPIKVAFVELVGGTFGAFINYAQLMAAAAVIDSSLALRHRQRLHQRHRHYQTLQRGLAWSICRAKLNRD